MIRKSVFELIGNTDLILMQNLSKKYNNEIYVKYEGSNLFGSIKDRVALRIIEEAIKSKRINKDTTIIEATSGNTGIGLAGICLYYGLKLIIVMPENASIERIKLMKVYKANVVLTDAKKGMEGAISKMRELTKCLDNFYIPSQFENQENVNAHYFTTAKEIENDLNDVDIIVAGIGTGGTITGIGKYFKEKKPDIKIIGVEPFESSVINGNKKGSHGIDGIGAGFVPSIIDLDVIDEVLMVKTDDAVMFQDRLVCEELIFLGISSCASFCGAIKYIENNNIKGKKIVIISPDSGIKYLSKVE